MESICDQAIVLAGDEQVVAQWFRALKHGSGLLQVICEVIGRRSRVTARPRGVN
jgi:hypothetical protein